MGDFKKVLDGQKKEEPKAGKKFKPSSILIPCGEEPDPNEPAVIDLTFDDWLQKLPGHDPEGM